MRSLSYAYAGRGGEPVVALSDVSFSAGDGEFVSIIGPSGCGKSTLLRIVADLLRPGAGSVAIGGEPPERVRRARRIGFVFQEPALMPWRSAQSNVALPLQVAGGGRHARTKAAEMLRLVGLDDFRSKRPAQLSGGMRQRVSIARALTYDPRVLLMDEPFGALDQLTRDEMNQELLRVWDTHRITVVFVTHSIAEAVYLSDRVMVMSPRPGTIKEIIPVNLERPRATSARREQAFFEIEARVLRALEGEI